MVNIITLIFALEIGAMPQNFVMGYEHRMPQYFEEVGFYTTIEGGIKAFNLIYVKGFVRTEMTKHTDKFRFNPNLALYGIEGGVNYGVLTIGGRYLCGHPVIPFVYRALKKPNFDTSYSEVFIRIESP